MSKRRVQSHGRQALPSRKSDGLKAPPVLRFLGVSLSGGKNAKTVVAVLEYYSSADRLVVASLMESVRSEDDFSGDDILLESIKGFGDSVQKTAFDVPLSLPKCATCTLVCPGISKCQEPHIKWFWKHHKLLKEKKNNVRLFTPYTQRPLEAWIADQEDCETPPSDALGANVAPLTARAAFLRKRLKGQALLEVYPRLSLMRLGQRHKLMKRHLKFHKSSVDGEKSRAYILGKWIEQSFFFIYHQDQMRLVENGNAFDALICALTAFEEHFGRTEKRPSDFPAGEDFLAIPSLMSVP